MISAPEDILDIAYADPPRALQEGGVALEKGDLDARQCSVVHRAMSVAHGLLSDFEAALSAAELAKESAVEARAPDEEFLAVLAMAGPMTVARSVEEASALVESFRHLATTPYLQARLAYQQGVLLRTVDRTSAIEQFATALPGLRQAGDLLAVRSALQNLSILWIDVGELERAEEALREALQIAEARGEEPSVSGIKHNLGRLAAHRGELTEALALLLESDEIYMRLTGASAPQHVARCEVLVSAGLFGEATALALQVAEQNRAAGDSAHLPDALRVAARSALAGGDPAGALAAAAEAADVYSQRGRPALAAEAERLMYEARYRLDGASEALLDQVSDVVSRLEEGRQVVEAAEANLLLGRIAADLGRDDRALAAWEPVARVDSGPIELRVGKWVARTRIALLTGNTRAADAAARSGLDLIDDYQTVLGATDLRFGLEAHGAELGRIGLDLAIGSGRPRRILRWMERTRARALRHPPVVAERDEATRAALTSLRRIEAELRDDRNNADLLLERRRLQEAVRSADRLKRATSSSIESFHITDLMEALEGRAMLELAIHDGAVIGVVIAGGQARRVEIGDAGAALAELRHVRFAMRRAARRRRPVGPDALRQLEARLLGDVDIENGEVVLVPPAQMMAAPWASLPRMRNKVVAIAPSAEIWWRAQVREARSGGVVVIGGPDLDHAEAEVEAVSNIHRGASVLPPGTPVEAVRAAMGSAAMAHVVCHAKFEVDNPMFSSLRLSGGDLYVYDIERLGGVPSLVVLSACDSGYTEARAGVELTGLTSALLSMGARSVVASVGLVPDSDATSQLMVDFHSGLRDGLSAPVALARAQSLRLDAPETFAAAASFVCVGA